MEDDPKVILMGEDIGRLGGVFRITDGLQKDFGEDRVIDTPLAESGIIGTAIGLALRGYRPVCEIQFDGFVYPAFDQIVSQLAKMHARSLGAVRLPIVVRIPVGGGIGAVEHHSESNEAYFAHTAGLRVVCCSNAADAYWMIQQAIASDDPVIFYEPKRRYWEKSEVDSAARPGRRAGPAQARVVLRRVSRSRWRRTGRRSRPAWTRPTVAAEEGRSIEVVDLRSPLAARRRHPGRLGGADRAPGRRARGVDLPRRRAPRSRPGSASAASCTWRRRSSGSAGSTCPTRRASSRKTSCPTSTACSTASTARWPGDGGR